jgi:hypothetical protein
LARGEIFLEQKDIVVMFCAKTMEGGHISRLEKGKVDNYLQEIHIGSQCLRTNLDLLQRRHKTGVMGSDSVDKVKENLEEATTIYDATIDSLINLHRAMLAQGVRYDLGLSAEDFTFFEGTRCTGTGEALQVLYSSSSIRKLSQFSS